MKLRDYQTSIAGKACKLLQEFKIAYLSMQVRTGKTLTALQASELYFQSLERTCGEKFVLFLTKKKAIESIKTDYDSGEFSFELFVTNYEQLPNLNIEGIDLIICDESHCLGQYPSVAQRTRNLKIIAAGLPIIYLSGSPTPESFSQIYHQLYVSSYSPFNEYKNFYLWAKQFVNKKYKYVFNRQVADYSHAKQDLIKPLINHLFLSFTQEEAGFKELVQEEILKVEMKQTTYLFAKKMKNERVHIGKNGEEIIADTEVKLMQKLHQIYSGTVLSEAGKAVCFDNYKVEFIKRYFKGQKIAIFYKFKAEFTMLLRAFGEQVTISPEEFNRSTDKVFCSQIQSGREGINLSTADALVMYNIDFSSVSYQQAKARIQTKDRVKPCLLYWIFSDGGIEEKIYERVINKQDYTLSYFRKDFKIKDAITQKA